ncbi:MAG TPA: site-2 protease family protein [Gammaproteobacteria bacterium]|nr:site-2 protease family protein [Gammaproteobacteria bacterium]
MGNLNLVQSLAIGALPIIFAITIHEASHGWVANRLGDPTARMLGRLSLNPVRHIDPLGTVVVPLLSLLLGGVLFGWAKPVPITAQNFRDPRRGMALVAVAGPASNLAMALFWTLAIKLALVAGPDLRWISVPLVYMGLFGVTINLVLMWLNMVPLPPLDGGRVLSGLLPGPMSAKLDRIEPYGLFIILALLFIPVGGGSILGNVLWPALNWSQASLFRLFGIGPIGLQAFLAGL